MKLINKNLISILILAFFRTIGYYKYNNKKAIFNNTHFQKNTTLTMYENFSSPILTLIIFGIYNAIENNVNILYYLLTPSIGLFLLWSLREEKDKLGTEEKKLLFYGILQYIPQAMIILYTMYLIQENENIFFKEINISIMQKNILLILLIITISELPMLFTHFKYFRKDIYSNEIQYKQKLEIIKVSFLGYIHVILYFTSFGLYEATYLFLRRALMVPLQNFYLNLKELKTNSKNILNKIIEMLNIIKNKPLITLKGGKDTIISTVDLSFNKLMKEYIKEIL